MNLTRDLFVDTSFFVALANSVDADHQRALVFHAQLKEKSIQKITSEYVLIELLIIILNKQGFRRCYERVASDECWRCSDPRSVG